MEQEVTSRRKEWAEVEDKVMKTGAGRLLGLGLVVLALVGAVPSEAAPTVRQQVWVFSYDGTAGGQLLIDGAVATKGTPGFYATSSVDVVGDALVPFFPTVIELGPHVHRSGVYGEVHNSDLCPTVEQTCAVDADGGFGFGVGYTMGRSEERVSIRFVIALQGTKIDLDFVSKGWKVTTRSGGVATSGGTAVAGVGAAGLNGEGAPSASLPGGASGSIAIALPPCDQAGAGTVTLSGGRQEQAVLCPTAEIADASRTKTIWVMTGKSAGATSRAVRLLVIDLRSLRI